MLTCFDNQNVRHTGQTWADEMSETGSQNDEFVEVGQQEKMRTHESRPVCISERLYQGLVRVMRDYLDAPLTRDAVTSASLSTRLALRTQKTHDITNKVSSLTIIMPSVSTGHLSHR